MNDLDVRKAWRLNGELRSISQKEKARKVRERIQKMKDKIALKRELEQLGCGYE